MTTMINKAFSFELVGQEALVHDSEGGVVVRLTGDEHSVIERLMSGEQIAAPTESEQAAIDRLLQAGIVLDDDPTSSTFSRRRVMQLSAAGAAAAGFAYLVLPSAAAAASGEPSPTTASTSTTLAPDPDPPTPSTSDASTSTNLSGLLSVRWGLGSSSAFNYAWLVEVPGVAPRVEIANGTAAANGFVSTGVTIPADTTYRVTLTAPGPLTAVFNVTGPVGP
jgi:hypothetical protein